MASPDGGIWRQTFGPDLMLLGGVWLILFVVTSLAARRHWRRFPIAVRAIKRRLGRFHGAGSNDGVIMIEFVLALPFYMFVCLLVAQTTLVMHAVLMVNYAGFVAARAAVVYPGQEVEVATKAAALACVPISPRENVISAGMRGVGADQIAAGLVAAYAGDATSALRWGYAQGRTRATVSNRPIEGAPIEDVTVTVEHDFHLSVPIARYVYSQTGRLTMTASCTLSRPVIAQGD